jgi:pimeloyl-ACP methyl ester carboxylesterase
MPAHQESRSPDRLTPVDTPVWFTQAIETPATSHFVDVSGTPIHYLAWNADERHKPGLVLAHGFRAHARWWSFIAPFLLERFRVVALDFSGMGDSGGRAEERYLFTQDILGVIEHADLGRAVLVGHSFGGGRVLRMCADHPEYVDRAVIIDTYVNVPELERRVLPRWVARLKIVYPTLEAALARFRLVPEHNCAAPYIIDYIARHSIKQVPGGWTWKFDENFRPHPMEPDWQEVSSINVPLVFMYGELSVAVSAERIAAVAKYSRHGRAPVAIPGSHHHVMLDQPLALVAALRAILY